MRKLMFEVEDTGDYSRYDALKKMRNNGVGVKNKKKLKKGPLTENDFKNLRYVQPTGNKELGAEGETGYTERKVPLKTPLPKSTLRFDPKKRLDPSVVTDKRGMNKEDLSHLDAISKFVVLTRKSKQYLTNKNHKRN